MIKIPFKNGAKSKNAYVTIDGTNHDVTDAVYTGETPLSAENLNQMQENIEQSTIAISSTEPTTTEKVWLRKTKNLFNYKTAEYLNLYIDGTTLTLKKSTTEIHNTAYIRCKPNTTYTFSKQAGKSFRIGTSTNKPAAGVIVNQTQANHSATTQTITTGENDNFLIFTCFSDYDDQTITYLQMYSTVQVELGTTSSAYEKHVEDKILIKNANGNYEKFSDTVAVDVKEPNTEIWFRKTKNLFNLKDLGATPTSINWGLNNGATCVTNDGTIEVTVPAGKTFCGIYLRLNEYLPQSLNSTITISADIKLDTGLDRAALGVEAYTQVNATSTEWTRYKVTSLLSEKYNIMYFYGYNSSDSDLKFYVKNIQIEYGSTATPYVDCVENKIITKNGKNEYEKFSDTVSIDNKEPNTGVWFKKSKNYLNFINETMTSNGLTTVISGNKATISGTTTLNWAGLQNYNYINLQPGKYTFSVKTDLLATYVVAVKYVDGTTAQQGLVTSATKKSMVLDFAKEVAQFRVNLDGMTSGTAISSEVEFQLEAGEVATDIEEAFEPEIMVKNTNGVFEEFIKKEPINFNMCENLGYFSAIDVNIVSKVGNLVQVTFRGLAGKDIPNNTSILRLPYGIAIQGMGLKIGIGQQYTYEEMRWGYANISINNEIRIGGDVSTGRWIHIDFVYMANQ